jgi:hypothetical protein
MGAHACRLHAGIDLTHSIPLGVLLLWNAARKRRERKEGRGGDGIERSESTDTDTDTDRGKKPVYLYVFGQVDIA